MAAPDAAHLAKFCLDGSSSDLSTDAGSSREAISRAPGVSGARIDAPAEGALRLRKHADYQRAYKASRKQFSPSMTYFHAPQPELQRGHPRVGITAGRVLGNAVERNRIKRRMREAIRANHSLLPAGMDVILHPRRSVLTLDYAELRLEVGRIFSKVAGSKVAGTKACGSSQAAASKIAEPVPGSKAAAVSGSRR